MFYRLGLFVTCVILSATQNTALAASVPGDNPSDVEDCLNHTSSIQDPMDMVTASFEHRYGHSFLLTDIGISLGLWIIYTLHFYVNFPEDSWLRSAEPFTLNYSNSTREIGSYFINIAEKSESLADCPELSLKLLFILSTIYEIGERIICRMMLIESKSHGVFFSIVATQIYNLFLAYLGFTFLTSRYHKQLVVDFSLDEKYKDLWTYGVSQSLAPDSVDRFHVHASHYTSRVEEFHNRTLGCLILAQTIQRVMFDTVVFICQRKRLACGTGV